MSESTEDYTQISGHWLSPATLADFALPTFHRNVEDVSDAKHVFLVGDGLVGNGFQRSTLQPKMMSAEEHPLCAWTSGWRIEAQTPGLLLGVVYDGSQNVKPTVRDKAGNPVWNPEKDWTWLCGQ